MLVLDANILIRAVLGKRVRHLLEAYIDKGVRFSTPDIAYLEAQEHLPPLLKKRGRSDRDLAASLAYLQSLIEPVDRELYSVFEAEARQRLRGRDEEDWPVLATALLLSCDLWTEDTDFFGTGVAVWTSDRVEIWLKRRCKAAETAETKEQ